MTKAFLNKIKTSLIQQREEILQLSHMADPEIDMDGDEVDEIQGKMLNELNKQLSSRNTIRIAQIDNALQKIANSEYGLCEDCEDQINEKRLLANPYFTTCISCAEEREINLQRK